MSEADAAAGEIEFISVLREIWCVMVLSLSFSLIFSHSLSLFTSGKEERKLQYGIPSLCCGQCEVSAA
jgi:hypothetical protein